jgi:glyoxylase-like metal-dependent hydrolase (beta-lactamase superfamily II)
VEELTEHDVVCLRADNPGPLTLSGTNTYVVGRDPAWVVDPGPALDAHVAAVAAEVARRGGLGGIALTHDHADHAEAIDPLRAAAGAPDAPLLAAGKPGGRTDVPAPLEVIPTPGHAPDHLAFLTPTGALLSGDAVLGEGSVFVAPDPGALAGYLRALDELLGRDLAVLLPGHGPVVHDAAGRIGWLRDHRLAREAALLDALAAGTRDVDGLLAAAWPEVPAELKPAAAATLASHLDKLDEEGRLPAGTQRPDLTLGRFPAAP